VSASLDPSNIFGHRDEVIRQSFTAGHRNVPSNATSQIHVQKRFLGPQMRALIAQLQNRAVSRALSHEEWHLFGAFAGPFRTPTVAATLHDPSGAEPSPLPVRFTIVFFALPVTVAPRQP
jgi:hypothetical protein